MGLFSRKKNKKPEQKKSINKVSVFAQNKKKDIQKSDINIAKTEYNKSASASSAIKWPIMSEKALNLISEQNQYIFAVNKKATKPEIKKQIEKIYNIKVEKVRVSLLKKGSYNFRGVKTKGEEIKRAFVTVKKGQKIDISGNI